MKLSGIVESGAGKGAFFTRVDWVVRQCRRVMKMTPFPGTLNVRIEGASLKILDRFFQNTDFELVPEDPAFCTAQVKKVTVNGVPAAVVLPGETVRIHENRVIELIAAWDLKKRLKVQDGDRVIIKDDAATTPLGQEDETTRLYGKIYDLAASAGALEGYVYEKEGLEPAHLDDWINNLAKQYQEIPLGVRTAFQPALDRTIGRAIHSLIPSLGNGQPHIRALENLMAGHMPGAYDDFSQEKADKSRKYGA